MKVLVIWNPPAGEAEREAMRAALSRHFAEAHFACELYETRAGDPLAQMVRQRLPEGFDLVVAAGGDGTVSAVGDGLAGTAIPLGIIPTGTGNLIARALNLPEEVPAAIALITGAPCIRKIDTMRIGDRAYILNISVGISASVIDGTTRRNKSRFGRIAYFETALLKLLSSKPRTLVVVVDGQAHPYRAVEVAIMNCGLPGQLIYPRGPDIRIDDGHLGVWILSMKSFWDYPRYFLGVAAGWTTHPNAQFIRAQKTVTIRSGRPLPVQADGDMIGATPIDVTVLPGALNVLVPKVP